MGPIHQPLPPTHRPGFRRRTSPDTGSWAGPGNIPAPPLRRRSNPRRPAHRSHRLLHCRGRVIHSPSLPCTTAVRARRDQPTGRCRNRSIRLSSSSGMSCSWCPRSSCPDTLHTPSRCPSGCRTRDSLRPRSSCRCTGCNRPLDPSVRGRSRSRCPRRPSERGTRHSSPPGSSFRGMCRNRCPRRSSGPHTRCRRSRDPSCPGTTRNCRKDPSCQCTGCTRSLYPSLSRRSCSRSPRPSDRHTRGSWRPRSSCPGTRRSRWRYPSWEGTTRSCRKYSSGADRRRMKPTGSNLEGSRGSRHPPSGTCTRTRRKHR